MATGRFDWSIGSFAFALLAMAQPACSGESQVAPLSDTAELCDGSSSIRLSYTNAGGGPLPESYGFTTPYGHEFFTVDGQCNYWVGRDFESGTQYGRLSSAQAKKLSQNLLYGRFAAYAEFRGEACPDASTRTLYDGKSRLSCTCSCDGPAEYRAAFESVTSVMTELWDAGQGSAPALRVLAQRVDGSVEDLEGEAWPSTLQTQLAEGALEPDAPASAFSEDAGQTVEIESDVQALRAQREQGVGGLSLVLEEEVTYRVYARDLLPGRASQALRANLNSRD